MPPSNLRVMKPLEDLPDILKNRQGQQEPSRVHKPRKPYKRSSKALKVTVRMTPRGLFYATQGTKKLHFGDPTNGYSKNFEDLYDLLQELEGRFEGLEVTKARIELQVS